MRAIQALTYGGPDVLELADLPVPAPGPGEVVVKVAAAATNPVDAKLRSGLIKRPADEAPWVYGWDIAGTVEAVGPGVTQFRAGDAVFGMPRFPQLARGYAEYVAAPAAQLAAKPDSLDFNEAAALALAGLTALQVLDRAQVSAGQRVFITAAAGGVGHLAVQLARARGAYVLGTAQAGNHDFLRSIGIDEPIDYTTTDVAATVRDLDLVLDSIHDDRLLTAVKPGGTYIKISAPVTPDVAAAAETAGVRAIRHVVQPDGRGLTRLAALATSGQLRVEIAEVLQLEDAAKAHQLLESGRTRGKIVLAI